MSAGDEAMPKDPAEDVDAQEARLAALAGAIDPRLGKYTVYAGTPEGPAGRQPVQGGNHWYVTVERQRSRRIVFSSASAAAVEEYLTSRH